MSFRSTEIYVQPKTRTRLMLAHKLYPQRIGAERPTGSRYMGVDEFADFLLNVCLREKCPEAFKLEREIEELEQKAYERCQNNIKQ